MRDPIIIDDTPATIEIKIDGDQATNLEAVRRVLSWNAEHSPGCAVLVWQSLRAGNWIVTHTAGRAFVHNRAAAV